MRPMNPSTKDNLVILGLGVGSAILFIAGGALLAISVADWQKWFSFVCWTAFTFGFPAYWYARGLKKPQCLAVFIALLVVHVMILLRCLAGTDRFPDVLFLFVSPIEATLVGMALMLVGGIPSRPARRPGRRRPRLRHEAPESTGGSQPSDAKEGRRS